jgi:hypothetical protein
VLYIANNKIADWGELDKLAGLPALREVIFTGEEEEQEEEVEEEGTAAHLRATGAARPHHFPPTLNPPSSFLLAGNPCYEGLDKAAAKLQVLKRIPHVSKIDSEMVSPGEREAAAAL